MASMLDNLVGRPVKDALDDDNAGSDRDHRKPERADEDKMRACLVCKKKFLSAWAGERICRHCKSTSAWRGGVL
jgi:hypothetical protein